MPSLLERALAAAVGIGATAVLVSCSSDAPTGIFELQSMLPQKSAAGKVFVCSKHSKLVGSILSIDPSSLTDHLSHGDYVTTLLVGQTAGPPVEGVHFARIGDALSAARTGRLERGELTSAACRITIVVSAGTYHGTTEHSSGGAEHFPMIVDVPDITLRGALSMDVDETGRVTGLAFGTDATTLAPMEPLPVVAGSSTPIIVANAHPDGSAGHGLRVEGFIFQSGHDPAVDGGGQGVLSVRAQRVIVRGNRFESGFTESIDLRASSGEVLQNHLGGGTICDLCVAGPGRIRVEGNRLDAGGIPGIVASGLVNLPLPSGVEPLTLPATAETWAEIRNNEVRDHRRLPVGVGIRVDALGVGAPNVHNIVHAVIQENVLVNNRFGLIVHAAFPVAGSNLRSDVDVVYGGNIIEESCQAKLLVSLSRHTTALGLTANPYLRNSMFQLSLGDEVSWDEVWFAHPAGFGNYLIVDGETIANGSRHFYDAVGCPEEPV